MPGDLSRAFKALGHPHRLGIVRHLIEEALGCDAPTEQSCTLDSSCCDFSTFVDEFGIGKSTVSHHLKELHDAGLVERFREGRRLYCRINEKRLAELRAFLDVRPSPGPV